MVAPYVIYAGLAAALIYLPMTGNTPTALRSVVKTLPLLCFALAAWIWAAPGTLIAGLLLSAAGDLALSREGEAAFLAGLSAFAAAHAAYIAHFLALSSAPLWSGAMAQPALAALLVLFAMSTELWLRPHVGRLRWPVRLYVTLITAMGLAALGLPLTTENASAAAGQMVVHYPHALVVLGAGLFILSDMVLSLQLFRMSEDNPLTGPAGWVVWTTYIAGQVLILTGSIA